MQHQALDGNASDKVSLVAAVEALAEQLRAAPEAEAEAPIFVADSGLYSAETVERLATAGVRWISRVPETSQEARTALAVPDDAWQQEGDLYWAADRPAPSGRRCVVRWTRRVSSGRKRSGIWATSVSRVRPTRRPRWTSN
jgi:hypothetical protein